jgi:hypothetical protein
VSLARAVRTLHRRQWVPRPLETVFDFFEHPENLALITPPWLGLRLRTPGPLTMRAGLVIDYHVRALGWTTRWRSLIAEYDPPYGFRDVQVIGPYRRGAAGRRGGREPAMSLDVRAATLATEAGGLRASCARCRRCRGVCLSRVRRASTTPVADTFGFGDRAIR